MDVDEEEVVDNDHHHHHQATTTTTLKRDHVEETPSSTSKRMLSENGTTTTHPNEEEAEVDDSNELDASHAREFGERMDHATASNEAELQELARLLNKKIGLKSKEEKTETAAAAEDDDDDDDDGHIRKMPFAVFVDIGERGLELFTEEGIERARKMFPPSPHEWSAFRMQAVNKLALPQLMLPLVPIAVPTPTLYLLLSGDKQLLYVNSFDLLLRYATLLNYVTRSNHIRSRRSALTKSLLELNSRGALTVKYMERVWRAYAKHFRDQHGVDHDPEAFKKRKTTPLPKITDLEEAVASRKTVPPVQTTTTTTTDEGGDNHHQGEKTKKKASAMIVDNNGQNQEKEAGTMTTTTNDDDNNKSVCLELKYTPESCDEITLAYVYARLKRDGSIPAMWIYRFVRSLPAVTAAATTANASGDGWDDPAIVCSEEIMADMYRQQEIYASQLQQHLEAFLRTPPPEALVEAAAGNDVYHLRVADTVGHLNREFTILLLRLREITLMRILAECTVDSVPLVRADRMYHWLAPMELPRPIMSSEGGGGGGGDNDDDDDQPMFHMINPTQVRSMLTQRTIIMRKRVELFVERTVIRDIYDVACDDNNNNQTNNSEQIIVRSPWSLGEEEARQFLRFIGRTYNNELHRLSLLKRASAEFTPVFIAWHARELKSLVSDSLEHLKNNAENDNDDDDSCLLIEE